MDDQKVWPTCPCLGCDLLLVWPSSVLDGDLLNTEESREPCTGHSANREPLSSPMKGELCLNIDLP